MVMLKYGIIKPNSVCSPSIKDILIMCLLSRTTQISLSYFRLVKITSSIFGTQ